MTSFSQHIVDESDKERNIKTEILRKLQLKEKKRNRKKEKTGEWKEVSGPSAAGKRSYRTYANETHKFLARNESKMGGMRKKEKVVLEVSMPSRGRRMKIVLCSSFFLYNLKKIKFITISKQI